MIQEREMCQALFYSSCLKEQLPVKAHSEVVCVEEEGDVTGERVLDF